MNWLQKLGEMLFRFRDYTPIPILIVTLAVADPSPTSLAAGLCIALLGESIRIYGVAFIGTISRTRSYSNGMLITTGPFALLRNPLYLGNLVLCIGLSSMARVVWLPCAVVLFFYIQYIPIVAWEEYKLVGIFGDSYREYCKKVKNRWFPSLTTMLSGNWWLTPDTWKPALKSEKRTFLAIFVFILIMTLLLCLKYGFCSAERPLARVPLYLYL